MEGPIEGRQQQQQHGDHRGDGTHQHPLGHGALAAVGEEEHVGEDHRRDEEEDDPELRGDHPDRPVDPVAARLLTGRRLVEPLVVRRLLAGGARLDAADRAEQLQGPRVRSVADGAVLHARPLDADDGAPVADELAGQRRRHGRRELLRVLDLLHEDERLGLRSRPGLVVALEGQEDDEAEQDGEAGGEDAEDAGCPIAVREVAALRRAAAHEEHRRDGDPGRQGDDECSPDEVHATARYSADRTGRVA